MGGPDEGGRSPVGPHPRPDGLDFLTTMETYATDVLYQQALADKLLTATYPWFLTYEDQKVIWADLYSSERCARFNIVHTAAIQHVGKETIVYGPALTVPTGLEITPGVHATWLAGMMRVLVPVRVWWCAALAAATRCMAAGIRCWAAVGSAAQ